VTRVNDVIDRALLIVTWLLGGLCSSANTSLFGAAIERSVDFPRRSGVPFADSRPMRSIAR
jgi:hypothetical protein